MRQIWDKYNSNYGWSIVPILLKPKSRGRIRLLANDVNVKPEIVPNYFDDPEDVKTMITSIKAAMSVGQTKAMKMFGSQLSNDTLPGCENYEYDSYAYWECAIRTATVTLYHYSGSCKMGARGDPTAVVDSKLKVFVERCSRIQIYNEHYCVMYMTHTRRFTIYEFVCNAGDRRSRTASSRRFHHA